MNTLKDLFFDELANIYDAEHRILKALPKLIEAATCSELKSALQHHLQETDAQAVRLENVFAAFNEKPRAATCTAMAGILEEGEKTVSKNEDTSTINAAIICAAQKVEHYEIAAYGCLRAWAEMLDNANAARLLDEILDEEKNADRTLTDLSDSKNEEALEGVGAGQAKSQHHNPRRNS